MDLNLLRVLDALLQESSVTRAAERLGTSPPAVSRSLARLRRMVGDPLLVRAGQGLVPTPRAAEIHRELGPLLRRADEILRPGAQFEPAELRRTFTVQASDLFVASVAKALLEDLATTSPEVNVVFVPDALEDTAALRRGEVDVEIGVLGHLDPETRTAPLTTVPMVGVARAGNPVFESPIDAERFAGYAHIGVSRRGKSNGPIDDELRRLGLSRRVRVVVPTYTSALVLASATDLIALTTLLWADAIQRLGLRTFVVPVEIPELAVGIAWHPRNDADPAHLWFRGRLSAAFLAAWHDQRIDGDRATR